MVKTLKIAGVVVFVIIVLAGAGLFRVTEAAKSPAYCASCHAMDPYVASTTNPTRLAAVHTRAAVTCQACHEQDTGQLVSEIVSNLSIKDSTPIDSIKFDTQACLNCHGTYAQLAARTRNLERNPHDSHQGQLDCRSCHQAHVESIYVCGQCHGADTMPKVGWVLPPGAQP
jgi:hypothetical protein